MIEISVSLAALVSALIQLVSHWFPWRVALGRDLPRVWAYVVGVLGFLLPVTGLYWYWDAAQVSDAWIHLIGLWVCVAASGLAVVLGYRIDWLLDRVRRSYEQEERDEARKE